MKPFKHTTGIGVLTTVLGVISSAEAQASLLDFSVDAAPIAGPIAGSKSAIREAPRVSATPPDAAPLKKTAEKTSAELLDFLPPPKVVDQPTSQPALLASEVSDRLPVPMPPPLADHTAVLPPPPEVSQAAETMAAAATDPLFAGGTHSLVAKAVGSAEGTRTPAGQRTAAYYGHVDPGNGAWNLGSFSYQHGADSPEAADEKQLARLRQQAVELNQQATQKALTLSLTEELNGIDLANQAPLAALDRGYIVWLDQARALNLPESEAILWARTRSFLDPDTATWNAPGLGNNVHDITQDQARRQQAIAQAIAMHQQFLSAPVPPTAAATAPEQNAAEDAAAEPDPPIDLSASDPEILTDNFLQQNY